MNQKGTLHAEPKEKADILNRQFQNAFSTKTTITQEEFDANCKMKGNFPTMPDICISEAGVNKLLKGLNPHKASGPDSITPRILKELADDISPILTLIFKQSYDTGELPLIWKSAFVSPIFKKGKIFETINYRPVSLTCISCKLLEHIITSNIMNHADNNKILNPLQHGFRKGLSFETQLVEFTDDI